ncbi:MAG: Asp/Glu/hydantoin racemase [Clostridia bacterium]|nr:Asp/Glu/hydantoin racemase [Clostridia bacterium]
MKILIINPNSDKAMTAAIEKTAKNYANELFQVVCMQTQGAPLFIETYADQMMAAPGMVKILKENEKDYDAFIVACHCDPNLDLLKESTNKPVIGIGEASMKIASMLGHSFSVVSSDKHSIPNKEAIIRKYHLQDTCASVRAPESKGLIKPKDLYLEASKLAIDEDMSEVIVLGCAGMSGLDKELEEVLNVPVLDGVVCALILAEGFARHGITTSKARRYNPNY